MLQHFALKPRIARREAVTLGRVATAATRRAIGHPGASGGVLRATLVVLFLVAPVAGAASLSQKQMRFSDLAARLVIHAEDMGYQVTFGEVWRSAEVASFKTKFNAAKGTGIVNSLHRLRLAIDLNLFRNGRFLTRTEDYRPLGEWWESQSMGEIRCRWGGRFKRADGNHFSVEHGGVQ